MGTVLLCRHGETTWNRDGRVQGWAPTSLTDRGRAQADALADAVAAEYDLDRLVASDLERAAETARALARETGVEATVDRRWRERDFGRLQGLDYRDLFGGYPQYALSETGYAAAEATPESGESLLDMFARTRDAFDELLAGLGAEETVAVVAHGGPLYAVTSELKGLDVVAAVLEQTQDNCALNEVRVNEGDATLVRENVTDFLPEELVERD